MSDAELADLIPRLSRASVLVCGDLMLDRFIYGLVSRISPEAPVPVLSIEREVALPGGAGNVVRNLTGLGAACAFVSVVGDDQAGSDLTGLIGGQPNVEPWLLVQGSRTTTVKTRFLAGGQQLLRADQEVTGAIGEKLSLRLCRIAEDALAATSLTVLSDYNKGVLAGDTPARIIAAAKKMARRVLAVPAGDVSRYRGTDLVCLSLRDLGLGPDDSTLQVAEQARALAAGHGFASIVINRGAQGLIGISGSTAVTLPAAMPQLTPPAGGRDTLLAALAASFAAGAGFEAALRIASLALGVASCRPGIAAVETRELLAMLTPQGRAQRKIMPPELAAEHAARWREAGLSTGFVALSETALAQGRIETARAGCDRLVVAIEAEEDDAGSAAIADFLGIIAARGDVDAVCVYAPEAREPHLAAIRPDVISVPL